MPTMRNLPSKEFLFNYIQPGVIVPLLGSVIQIVIDSPVSAPKKGWNIQFVRFGMVDSRHGIAAKRHTNCPLKWSMLLPLETGITRR